MQVSIHILKNYAPSALNADDNKFPKTATFGGFLRSRISSQCLKRAIRLSEPFQAELNGHVAKRTRKLPELVKNKLVQMGCAQEYIDEAIKILSNLGKKDLAVEAKEVGATSQIIFISDNDINDIAEKMFELISAAKSVKEFAKSNFDEFQESLSVYRPITADIALFGRMTTSAIIKDVESSIQVAHAISTTKHMPESDYFIAAEDLGEDDSGAAMIGDTHFNSPCYYEFYTIDVNNLIDNLSGVSLGYKPSKEEIDEAKKVAIRIVVSTVEAIAKINPSGKQNSFAAHNLPSLILAEVLDNKAIINYANAFVNPVEIDEFSDTKTSVIDESINLLAEHADAYIKAYNLKAVGRFSLTPMNPSYSFPQHTAVNNLDSLLKEVNTLLTEGQK